MQEMIFPTAAVERSCRHSCLLLSFFQGKLSGFPLFQDLPEVFRRGNRRPAEEHAPDFGCRDTGGMALSDVDPFVFAEEGEDLQDFCRTRSVMNVVGS